jgi:hypothetical protein
MCLLPTLQHSRVCTTAKPFCIYFVSFFFSSKVQTVRHRLHVGICIAQPITQLVLQLLVMAVRDIRMLSMLCIVHLAFQAESPFLLHSSVKKDKNNKAVCDTIAELAEWDVSICRCFPIRHGHLRVKYQGILYVQYILDIGRETLQFGQTVHFLQEATIFTA